MDAKEELRKKAQAIKAEVDAKKDAEATKHAEIVKKSADAVMANAQLAQMYRDNASLGSENLSGSLPTLKVHATGKSSKNFLSNGKEPSDGAFFYVPTQEQFEGVTCHVLTISKGYRAADMNGKSKFNQILGGVITNGGVMRPFIMYFTGSKLKNMWEFGKEAGQYTKSKTMPIPLFALSVKMTTEKIKSDYGMNWIINFEILKEEDGTPILVSDTQTFTSLRNAVTSVEDKIASLIDSKSVAEVEDPGEPASIKVDEKTGETVNPEDIPF